MTDLNSTNKTLSSLEILSKEFKPLKAIECFNIYQSTDRSSNILLLGYNKNGDIEGQYVQSNTYFAHDADPKLRQPYYALGILSEYTWRQTRSYGLAIYSPIHRPRRSNHLIALDNWSQAVSKMFDTLEEAVQAIRKGAR